MIARRPHGSEKFFSATCCLPDWPRSSRRCPRGMPGRAFLASSPFDARSFVSFISAACLQAPTPELLFWWQGTPVKWQQVTGVGMVLLDAHGGLCTAGAGSDVLPME